MYQKTRSFVTDTFILLIHGSFYPMKSWRHMISFWRLASAVLQLSTPSLKQPPEKNKYYNQVCYLANIASCSKNIYPLKDNTNTQEKLLKIENRWHSDKVPQDNGNKHQFRDQTIQICFVQRICSKHFKINIQSVQAGLGVSVKWRFLVLTEVTTIQKHDLLLIS